MQILVVTAVDAERDAIVGAAGPGARVVTVGVGPAAAAAGTARALDEQPADLVLCAGVGGGFAPVGVGDVVVATRIVHADLGAESAEGFLPMSTLGFGTDSYDVAAKLGVELADRTGGHLGAILTVSTVTGTAATAQELVRRHPDARAEAMEGAGVAAAAGLRGIAVGEIRAVSNSVGPRDRSAWQLPAALQALGTAVAAVLDAETDPQERTTG
ncbi:futalosine hydrolase [uncultured Jatrophihabitans sp.]|uniref:futalosine hydrolase n=1 Tax=uncultured Jatrophihabitans sp. TaxID=1610747 RepID=UPI0035CC530B